MTDTTGDALLDDVHNGLEWECYNPGWTEDQMRTRYAEKHQGEQPRYIVKRYGMAYLGPIGMEAA